MAQSKVFSETIESIINDVIGKFDGTFNAPDGNFEQLIGLAELVDKLSIVNFKLYTLKNEVIRRSNDEKFRSWASEEDVKLCRLRGLLKNCIDDKLQACISKTVQGKNGSTVLETKLYN